MLSACVSPVPLARTNLQSFLVYVQSHSVAYAYDQLSQTASSRTDYDSFFNLVMATNATYKVQSARVISSTEVAFRVRVQPKVAGAKAHVIGVQMLEEGNAGNWAVNAPFSIDGAAALHQFG